VRMGSACWNARVDFASAIEDNGHARSVAKVVC
jgi:hypothetical protein